MNGKLAECCVDAANKDKAPYGFVVLDDGSIAADSCCGGCFALSDIKFCPYCGKPFQIETVDDAEAR
jgi:hypothetical protein